MSRLGFRNPYPDFDASKLPTPYSIPVSVSAQIQSDVLEISDQVFHKSGGEHCEGGIYAGPAGIAYMFIHVIRSSPKIFSDETKSKFLAYAQKEFQTNYSYIQQMKPPKSHFPSFLVGKAGICAVGAVLGNISGNEALCKQMLQEFAEASQYCLPLEIREGGSDEMFNGRAGYLCGALWLQRCLLVQPVPIDNLRKIWCAIIESGKLYSKSNRSQSPLMYCYYKVEYLGAAHGLSSILQVLLSFPEFLVAYPESERLIQASIDFYMTLQDESGNFPCALDEVGPDNSRKEEDKLVHWCHGAPGVIYLFAKAYLHFKEQKYLDVCLRCGDLVWERGLLKKGPGICHGITGNGYVFLLLNKLTRGSDPKHLYRATKFYEFLSTQEFKTEARTPDCPYSLFEGLAGAVCFMSDLLNPNNAEFPFFEI